MINDFKETAVEYLTCDDYACFFSSEKKWIKKMRELADRFPDDVRLVEYAEDAVNAFIPKSWLKITPPRRRNISDERRAELAERARAFHKMR